MDAVTEYWLEAETRLSGIESTVKELRDDHMLQKRIRSLSRDWKETENDYKTYKTAVGHVHSWQSSLLTLFQLVTLLDNNPQYALFIASNRTIAAAHT